MEFADMKTEPVMGDWGNDQTEPEAPLMGVDGAFFYGGARREALLEQILHLQQFVAGVVVVLAEDGLGKTTLRQRLEGRLPPDCLLCSLGAGDLVDPRQVFAEIANALELPFEASAGQQLAAIRAHVQEPEAAELVVLLDDAHLLDDHVLSGLMSLLQGVDSAGAGLSLILFGLPELADRIDRFQMVDVQVNDLIIPPLNIAEVAEYLLLKYPERMPAGRKQSDTRLAAGIWQETMGNPAEIDLLMARQGGALVAPEASELRKQIQHYKWHIVAAAGLVVVLALILLSWSGDEGEPEVSATRQLAVPLPNPIAPQAVAPVDGVDVVPAGAVVPLPPPVPMPQGTAVGSAAAAAGGAVQRSPAPVGVVERAPASAVVESAPVAALPQPQPTPVAVATPAVKPTAAAAKAAAPAGAVTAPKVASAPAAGSGAAVTGGGDEQFLLGVNGQHFALQILAAESRAAVQKYVQAQSNRQQLRIYETRREGKPWFVVVLGDYATREMAQKAIAGLPDTQRKAGAWPKSYASIQAEIKADRGD
jgi:DamX protein